MHGVVGCASTLIGARFLWASGLALILFASARSAAQTPPEDPRQTSPTSESAPLVPPEPLETPLSYPEGESSHASVVLDLVVDASGAVREARVVRGEAPFAEAARSAALSWRFEPARRNGQALAARIRYTVHFAPLEPDPFTPTEPQTLAPRSESQTDSLPQQQVPSQSSPAESRIEIVVSGERRRVGSVNITRNEAEALPGTFGDPLRAIEAQPGVVPIVSGLPAFFIRGAPPANVGFFIDGVDLPLLYHAFLGPSVIHPAIIGSVDFYRAAAPAQYGRFAGPVIAVRTAPFEGRLMGEATLRVIDVGAFVEAPMSSCDEAASSECSRNSARVAGRYSYTGLILSALSAAKLDYWDYLGEARVSLGRNDSLGVLAFGAYDFFRAPQEAENSGGELTFHRVDLRWDRRITSRTTSRVAVTAGYDRAAGAVEQSSVVSDHSLRGRAELVHRISDSSSLYAGMDARRDRFGLQTNPRYLSYPDYSTLFPERIDLVTGAYVEADFTPARGVRVAPGVRADVYRSQGTTVVGFDPRVSADFQVTRSMAFEHSLGMAHQRPNFAAQVPGAQVADLSGGLQRALMFSSGVRWRLPADVSASAAMFRTAYFRALDPIGGGRDFTLDRTLLDRRTTISAAGLELQLSRPLTQDLGGFVSYTLSRSEHSIGQRKTVSGFDRPHVLQAALAYDFGSGIRASARTLLYSGIPELNLEGSPHFTSRRRGSPYFRLDLRAEKRWDLGETTYVSVVADVLNATSTREVVRLDCGEGCRERVAGPVVLPSIGAKIGY